jgi:thiol-disulfide isomerase/thioredoxin
LDEYKHDRGVIRVTSANAKEIINKFDYTLIEFAKKTCKSCLALSPILERLNQAFHKHLEFPIPVGRVQCDEQTFFCTRIHEVTHYPTLRLYTNHKEHFAQYKGPIDFPRIARWVNDRVFNSLIRITTEKHIQNIKK